MKKSYIIITVLVVILVGVLIFTQKNDKNPITESTQNQNTVSVSYSNESETVNATFNNNENTVSFTQKDTGAVTLPIAMSASGARYANADESLVFWEHQGEATISKDGQDVFVGKILNGNNSIEVNDSLLGSWIWQETKTSDEKTIAPKDRNAFVLSINNDGSINSTTDCNNLMGQYTLKSNTGIKFENMASTKKYCEGSQENEYVNELTKTVTYSVDGDTLTLGTGGGVMTFKRQ